MEILKDSQWKYKLPFDNTLYKQVKRYSFDLPKKTQEKMAFEIDFYRTFFSIAQVLDCISKIKTDTQLEKFKYAVEKRINCLLYCPDQLVPHFKSLIQTKFEKNKEFLLKLLKHANKYGFIVNPSALYKNIFGKKIYSIIKKKCKKYARRNCELVTSKRVQAGGSKYFVQNLVEELKKDFSVQTLWGKYDIKNFDIIENTDFGYGKWCDEKVSYLNNAFYLNSNMFTAKECDLEYSTFLNVYPGSAHFYSKVLKLEKTNHFDNGALFLINGWSYFAGTHFKPCTYTRNVKYQNCKVCKYLINKKYNQKNIDNIYAHLLSFNSKNNAIQLLINITQYLGLFESSVFGAIAVEYLVDLNHMGPKNFLNFLSKCNIGNFFEDYLSKMIKANKKLK